MTATPNLFSLSFDTKADAGEGGLNFLRPTAYTAEQLLVEILDLVKNPANMHVEGIEVMRIGGVVGEVAAPQLAPVSLASSNASVGWSFESYFTYSDVPQCTVIDNGHEAAAAKLVELLGDPKMESFKLYW
jgi:hypothetical protein